MCWQDVEIGRAVKSGSKMVSLESGVSRQIAAPSPDRLMIIFQPPAVGTVWLSFDRAAVVGVGFPLIVSNGPLVFHVGHHMDLPMRGWNAIIAGSTPTFSVTEGILFHARTGHTESPQRGEPVRA